MSHITRNAKRNLKKAIAAGDRKAIRVAQREATAALDKVFNSIIYKIDAYKLGHMVQYPEGTTKVYCNLTARNFRHAEALFPEMFFNNKAVVLGTGPLVQQLHEGFEEFFDCDIDALLAQYATDIDPLLGGNSNEKIINNLRSLHSLGYLPLVFKSLPEGSQVGPNVPMLTWTNTHPDFAWLPNYLETYISTQTWQVATAATIGKVYKRILTHFYELTGCSLEGVLFGAHDFSLRGLGGADAGARVATGHAANFLGSDAVSTIPYIRKYYSKSVGDIIYSIPATEHSVMCMGKKENEKETIRRIIKDLYPNGLVGTVIDTWDFWKTLTVTIPELKDLIMERDGKAVWRPDSGVPEDIICGTKELDSITITSEYDFDDWKLNVAEDIDERFREVLVADDPIYSIEEVYNHNGTLFRVEYIPDLNRHDKTYYYIDNDGSTYSKCTFKEILNAVKTPEQKGAVECLWDTFDGTITGKGFKELDSHVGLIYGDSITPFRAVEIFTRLFDKNFAASNCVLGVGSFTYQHLTRDTLGFAVKATYGEVFGIPRMIAKEPKTDSGKKSAFGMMRVEKDSEGNFIKIEGLTNDDGGYLEVIYYEGDINTNKWDEVVERLGAGD